jgi:hypothetical protein
MFRSLRYGRRTFAAAGLGAPPVQVAGCRLVPPTIRLQTIKGLTVTLGEQALYLLLLGGRYWDRTSDLFRVKE